MQNIQRILALVLSLLPLFPAWAITLSPPPPPVIDDFTQFQETIVKKDTLVPGPTLCDSFSISGDCVVSNFPATQVTGSMLGGFRDLYANTGLVSGLGMKGTSATINGSLNISNDANVAGMVTLVWDGAHIVTGDPGFDSNIDQTGLGGIDWGAWNWLALTVLSTDIPYMVDLTIWDMLGATASTILAITGPDTYQIRFDDLVIQGAPDFHWDQIGAMRMTFAGMSSWDTTIAPLSLGKDPKHSVPEPSMLALLGTGLLLIGWLTTSRHRRAFSRRDGR